MDASNFSWNTSDGLKIHAAHWSVDQPVAAVGFVHGMGEHSARYQHVAAAFAEAKIASMGYDRRGHGQSEGKRGHTISFEAFIEEVKMLVTNLKKTYGDIPVFLYGHSMGGNLVLNYLVSEEVEVDGIIASAPWIQLAFKPSPVKIQAGKWVRSLLPGLSMKNELNPDFLSRIPAEVKAYVDDPLVHDKITPNTGVRMLDKAEFLHVYDGKISHPLLIMHGTDDQIISYQAAKDFADRVEGPVEFKTWEGGYHEIHNDLEKEAVIAYAKDWMLQQVKTA